MRTFIHHAQWLALVVILALGLTACFQSAGEDVQPTAPGVMAVDQTSAPGPTATPLVQPTQEPTTEPAPTIEEETPLPSPIVMATETPVPTQVEALGGSPTPTQTAVPGIAATHTPLPTATQLPTNTPQPTVTPQPTFTPVPPQATFTPQPTHTPLPTYTPQPTFTQPAIVPGGPTATYTAFPRVTFAPTATYTPFPPGAFVPGQTDGQGGFAGQPQEGIPLAERPTLTLAPGGVGGPRPTNASPAVVDEPVTFSPTPLGENPPPPSVTPVPVAQVPTLTILQMTSTQVVYQATANAAATLGIPTPLPPGIPTQPIATQDPFAQPQPTQPGAQPQPVAPAAGYPPNATVITATPFGTPGMCSEHLIQVGETLYRIALQYGVSADEIAVANNILNPDLIEAGSTLLIPCVVPATPTPAQVPVVQGAETGSGQGGQGTTATSRQIYTVQAGDNIYQISLRFGVDMAELVAINGLNAVTMNMIYVGQELIIPGTAVVIVTPTPVGATPAPVPAQPTATPYIIIITNTPIPGTTG